MTATQTLPFDPDLIRRYDTAGPRYTSYPTAVEFRTNFNETDDRQQAVFSIQFHDYFADELDQLPAMQADGLLTLDANGLTVQPAGRLLIRNICMLFDRYRREQSGPQRYSKVI